MAIKRNRKAVDFKIPNAKVLAKVCGKSMWLWVDNGLPVTIFSLQELTKAMGRENFYLIPGRDEFLDYNNNRIHILGKAEVMIELSGWVTQQKISVIGGNHESILGRDLMGSLGLELVQRDRVMSLTEDNTNGGEEHQLDEWQLYFC